MPSLVVPRAAVSSLQLVSSDHNQRRLSKEVRSGTKRLLAVRLLTNGGSEVPDETISEIQDTIFGSKATSTQPTVISQYAAVSHGKLQFIPAQGPGIDNGVVEIVMDAPLTSGNISIQGPMLVEILESAASALGDLEEVADHIIFCLPTGSLLNGKAMWTGFTYLYEPYSYYQRSRCTKLSVPMHEIGHAVLGFKHSGKGKDSYADEQGYMGYAINQLYGPQKGFNAHKHWMSGWFDNRAVDIQSKLFRSRAMAAPLVSFVDASNLFLPRSEEAVVLKIGPLYVQYNLAKGYNAGTYIDQKDRVTITLAEEDESVSDLVAALAENEIYRHPNFDGIGNDLIIETCAFETENLGDIDYALVSIHLDDGVQSSLCGNATIRDKTWRGTGQSWLSNPAMPTVAPSFNVDHMSADPLNQRDDTNVDTAVPSPAPAVTVKTSVPTVTFADSAATSEIFVENDKPEPTDIARHGPADQNQQERRQIPILMIVIAGASAATVAGLLALFCCCSTSSSTDKFEKPEELERTETDLSERSEEDDNIIEVRMVSPARAVRPPNTRSVPSSRDDVSRLRIVI